MHAENEKKMRKLSLYVLLTLLSLGASAQTGVIKGLILDQENKLEIIGASVMPRGGLSGVNTNIDGVFILKNQKAGKLILDISYIGYEKLAYEVNVLANDTTFVTIELKNEAKSLKIAKVKGERNTHTEQAVVTEVKQSQQVVNAVSSEQIKKSQDNNAAQVVQRIPGVTVVDNRFVMIRGLSERYNNVLINNVVAPSTEVDRRTFSFDLISSGALDRMLIYKSGNPEMPGDFAGGIIKIYTIENVSKNYTHFNMGLGYRGGTTFTPYEQSEGSKTDFLGFDNSFRPLSGAFPTTESFQTTGRNSAFRMNAAHTLPNNFTTQASRTTPDMSFGLNTGRLFKIKNIEVSAINNINYSISYLNYERDFNRYFEWVDQEQPILKRFNYVDQNFQKDVKINILSNWVFKINQNNKIKFKNLFNQIGENETIIRNGIDFIQEDKGDLRNYLLGYRSRSIYTGQLEGNHIIDSVQTINWVGGFSYLNESEPDLRRFRTFRPPNSTENEGYQMQLPPSSNLFETGRYFGKLDEKSFSHGLDYIYKLGKSSADKDESSQKLQVGYYTDYRTREFSSRYFSYLYPGFFDPAQGEIIKRLPLDQIFANENIKTTDGLILEEGTRPIDSYTASNFLTAAYAQINLNPTKKLNISGGIRLEHNIQTMKSRDDFGLITVENPVTSPLPLINLGYSFTEKTKLRASYSRTINRPEFRELAPFLFYDYKLEAGRVGNPNLKTATIDNFDLRYEVYPRPGETVSVGVFYKNFTNPIENKTIITTEQPTFTFINADRATNYGLEIELRKSLEGVFMNKFLDKLSFNFNGSLIKSQVDLGVGAVAQSRVRALQGQSPFILNMAMSYNNPKKETNVTLVYNIFGDRIYSVGDVLFPTIYERSRHSLDFTLNTKLQKGITFKFGVQDVLNFAYRFYQDSDRDEKITDKDHSIVSYRRGSYFSFGFSFDISGNKTKK